jgi:hypothetical protein
MVILLVPARSAPAYEHQLQHMARIRGSKDFFLLFSFVFVFPSALDVGLVVDKYGPPLIKAGDKFNPIKLPIQNR